jgi:class 3 adenylate cyclase
MLRQFFRPNHPRPVGIASPGSASSVSGRLTSVVSRRWPLWADRTARNNGYASRLLAAVHTDMVGYSRLFALDDSGTVARLRDLRRNLVAPAIRRHHGQLVQTAGDSMLITFDSVTQAVKCAVTIQYELGQQNSLWPHDRQMHLRVGIDLGDVFEEGTDFHGDGVIIAARLQAVCPHGGVCVSQAVHDRGGDRLGLRSEALGPLRLKHCARPVEAFVLWPSPHPVAGARQIAYANGAQAAHWPALPRQGLRQPMLADEQPKASDATPER